MSSYIWCMDAGCSGKTVHTETSNNLGKLENQMQSYLTFASGDYVSYGCPLPAFYVSLYSKGGLLCMLQRPEDIVLL